MAKKFLFRAIVWLILCCSPLAMAGGAAQSVGKEQAIEWHAMTPTQQQILAPLATQWNGLPAIQRVRLLEVAAKYPSMKPEARQRFQARIKNWALLSKAERKKARENYKKLKHLSPEQRAAIKRRWEIKQQASEPIRPSVPAHPVAPALTTVP